MSRTLYILVAIVSTVTGLNANAFTAICDRPVEVRKILEQGYGIKCEALTEAYINSHTNVFEFNLSGTSLTKIKKGDLEGLPVYDLTISNNPMLTEIEGGAFDDVALSGGIQISANPLLQKIGSHAFRNVHLANGAYFVSAFDGRIEISNNSSLIEIASEAFLGLTNVRQITITNNPNLQTIAPRAFKDITVNYNGDETMVVDVHDNASLRALGPAFLYNVASIGQLTISNNNSLTTLPAKFFDQCTFDRYGYLPTIEIRNNASLTDIQPGLLTPSIYISKRVDVTIAENNSLPIIKSGTFAGIDMDLNSVTIQNNASLELIEPQAFQQLNVKSILVKGNPSLKFLTPGFIAPTVNSDSIEISQNNALDAIAAGTFKGFTSGKLKISQNAALKMIEAKAIDSISNLYNVNIEDNALLENLEPGFLTLPQSDLTLPYSDLRTTSLVISNNPSLARLRAQTLCGSKFSSVEITDNSALEVIEESALSMHSNYFTLARNNALQTLNSGAISVTDARGVRIYDNPSLQKIESGAVNIFFMYATPGWSEPDEKILSISDNPSLTTIKPDSLKIVSGGSPEKLEILRSSIKNFDPSIFAGTGLETFSTDTQLIENMAPIYPTVVTVLPHLELVSVGALPLPSGLFAKKGLQFDLLTFANSRFNRIPSNTFTMAQLGLYAPLAKLDLFGVEIEAGQVSVDPGAFNEVGQVFNSP